MSADYLISKLNHVKEVKPRRKNKRSWIAQCPAHNDKTQAFMLMRLQMAMSWLNAGQVAVQLM